MCSIVGICFQLVILDWTMAFSYIKLWRYEHMSILGKPGIGHFSRLMRNLESLEWFESFHGLQVCRRLHTWRPWKQQYVYPFHLKLMSDYLQKVYKPACSVWFTHVEYRKQFKASGMSKNACFTIENKIN